MAKYVVQLETTTNIQVEIEADSPEQAVRLAEEQHGRQTKKIELKPIWVEEAEKSEATGELSMKIHEKCARCEQWIVHRDIPGQPYTYDFVGHHSSEMVCYSCLEPPLKQLGRQAKES